MSQTFSESEVHFSTSIINNLRHHCILFKSGGHILGIENVSSMGFLNYQSSSSGFVNLESPEVPKVLPKMHKGGNKPSTSFQKITIVIKQHCNDNKQGCREQRRSVNIEPLNMTSQFILKKTIDRCQMFTKNENKRIRRALNETQAANFTNRCVINNI